MPNDAENDSIRSVNLLVNWITWPTKIDEIIINNRISSPHGEIAVWSIAIWILMRFDYSKIRHGWQRNQATILANW